MTFTERDINANRDYFAAKIAAEKTKYSVAERAAGNPHSEDFLILDVRDRESFAKGHIKGSLSVPQTELETFMARLPKDRELVTYCHHHY
jgi:rhodanese-related sulfurtransferase